MKRYLLLFSLLLLSFNNPPTDTVTIVHKAYKTTYSKSKNYPVKVEWWLTKKMIDCSVKFKRTDNFGPDPQLPKETDIQQYFNNSGFDRGHNFPAADGGCDFTMMLESFYFSNMTAQYPQLNRGDWKAVEELTRLEASQNDSIHIWAGSIGETKRIGRLSVPKQCWKVIYIKKTNEWFAFLFNNDTSKPNGINDNKVTVSTVENLTGYKFKAK